MCAVTVEKVDHGEADCRCEEPVEGVQNGVPVRYGNIKMVDFAENFR